MRAATECAARCAYRRRQALYKKGGLMSVTSQILTVDMLTSDIPTHLITGIKLLHAERCGLLGRPHLHFVTTLTGSHGLCLRRSSPVCTAKRTKQASSRRSRTSRNTSRAGSRRCVQSSKSFSCALCTSILGESWSYGPNSALTHKQLPSGSVGVPGL